jgi:hypothetical protein
MEASARPVNHVLRKYGTEAQHLNALSNFMRASQDEEDRLRRQMAAMVGLSSHDLD